MKCHDSDADSLASAHVVADGVLCSEYNVVSIDGDLQCWVPVNTGQTLTLVCGVQTSSSRCQMDLIVDGVLRDTKSSSPKKVPTSPRVELFDTACFRDKSSIQRGTMKVMSLSPTSFLHGLGREDVGTLEIRLYKTEANSAVHKQSITSLFDVDSWRDLAGLQGTSSIQPTHEIQFADATSLKPGARSSLKSRLKQERPGNRHWLSFKFFFRSRYSIAHANLELQEMSPEHVIQLTRIVSTAIMQTDTLGKPGSESAVADDDLGVEKDAGGEQNQILETGESSGDIQRPVIQGDSLFVPEHAVSSKVFDSTRPAVDGQAGEKDHLDAVLESREATSKPRDQHSGFAAFTHKVAQYNAQRLDSTEPRDGFRFGVLRDHHSITPSTISTNNSPTPHDRLEEEAAVTNGSPSMGSLLHHAALSNTGQQDGPHNHSNIANHTEEPQPIEQSININAMKRRIPSILDGPGSVDRPSNGNNSNATPKRRKKDVDAFRAKVEEARKVMEESKRRAEEERRRTDERQHQLEQEWEELQQAHEDYERLIEESRRDTEAALREREDLESTSP